MTFVSLTRLRVRSIRFLPGFLWNTFRVVRQVKQAAGFRTGALLKDRQWTFWAMTAWDSQESMRQFMTSDAHKKVMPYLLQALFARLALEPDSARIAGYKEKVLEVIKARMD